MDPLTERLKSLDGGRILDVATGSGEFLKHLSQSFGGFSEGVGIDPTEARINAASEKPEKKLSFKIMDAEEMAFDDASFDTVAIRHSLHHLQHIDKVLSEMVRVLKPGGLMIIGEVIQDPATERPNSQRHLHHWWGKVDRTRGVPHFETFTREQVLTLIQPLGLREEDVFEFLEEYCEEDRAEALKFMLDHSEKVVGQLRESGDQPQLAAEGERLVALFGEQGYIDEKTLYVMGRRPA